MSLELGHFTNPYGNAGKERNEINIGVGRCLEGLIAIIPENESLNSNFTSSTILDLAGYERYPMLYLTPHMKRDIIFGEGRGGRGVRSGTRWARPKKRSSTEKSHKN